MGRLTRIVRAALIATLTVVVTSAALGFFAYRSYRDIASAPLAHLSTPVDVDVPRGASVRHVARRLEAEGVLAHPVVFVAEARRLGLATRIQAGEYEVRPTDTLVTLLERLAAGDTKRYSLTIVEGHTFVEALRRIRAHPKIAPIALQDGVLASPEAIVSIYALPFAHPEGSIYPDTYEFTKGTTDRDIVARARDRLVETLQSVWAQRAEDLPLDRPYDALVLASIVEKETAVADERPRIAGVFVRRLRRGMKLQTDPTVIYGLGERFDGDLRRRDLEADTPYNTYTRTGLPPTPIALVGREAIFAAVRPADGEALYFVARGDGTHAFSASYAEHVRAVRKYQLGGR